MNANDIWAGQIYAHKTYKGNDADAPPGADKVRAIKVIKRLEPVKVRETAYVLCEVIEVGDYGNWQFNPLKVGDRPELRVRDFIDFWSDYAHRREELDKAASEREERARIAREEAEAKRLRIKEARERQELEARIAREKEKNELLDLFAARTGIPRNLIKMEYHLIGINKNSPEVVRWLHDV